MSYQPLSSKDAGSAIREIKTDEMLRELYGLDSMTSQLGLDRSRTKLYTNFLTTDNSYTANTPRLGLEPLALSVGGAAADGIRDDATYFGFAPGVFLLRTGSTNTGFSIVAFLHGAIPFDVTKYYKASFNAFLGTLPATQNQEHVLGFFSTLGGGPLSGAYLKAGNSSPNWICTVKNAGGEDTVITDVPHAVENPINSSVYTVESDPVAAVCRFTIKNTNSFFQYSIPHSTRVPDGSVHAQAQVRKITNTAPAILGLFEGYCDMPNCKAKSALL